MKKDIENTAQQEDPIRKVSEKEKEVIAEQDRQKRVADCSAVIRQALEEFQCDLDASIVLRAGQIIPRISVIPIEVLRGQQQQSQQ